MVAMNVEVQPSQIAQELGRAAWERLVLQAQIAELARQNASLQAQLDEKLPLPFEEAKRG